MQNKNKQFGLLEKSNKQNKTLIKITNKITYKTAAILICILFRKSKYRIVIESIVFAMNLKKRFKNNLKASNSGKDLF